MQTQFDNGTTEEGRRLCSSQSQSPIATEGGPSEGTGPPTSYNKVAMAAGIPPAHFSRVMRGIRNLTWPDALRVAAVMECPPHIFLRAGGTAADRRAA